jgi:BASS family bile acid:Na+ symporter
MEQSILSTVVLPLSLAVIMLGMGLGLEWADFRRVTLYPKAVFTGLFSQLVLLPVTALLVVFGLGMDPVLGLGLMVLAFCPGGATSNLITHLSKGDTALSITLTALSSTVTVFTLPYLINWVSNMLLGEGQFVALPVGKTMVQILLITILPVAIGMVLRKYSPGFAQKADKPVRIASVVFIVLVILGIAIKEKDKIPTFFAQAGLAGLLLNVGSMAAGWIMSTAMNLVKPQRTTVIIETGIQNGTLAIAITAGLMGNETMAIPAAIYSLIMFFTAGLLVPVFTKYMRAS